MDDNIYKVFYDTYNDFWLIIYNNKILKNSILSQPIKVFNIFQVEMHNIAEEKK